MRCCKCDQLVQSEEEHYNDGIDGNGDMSWDIAGWTCKAIDWRKLYKEAFTEIKMLKLAVLALNDLVNADDPADPLSLALQKTSLYMPIYQDVYDEKNEA